MADLKSDLSRKDASLYHYKAVVTRVVDGDTIICNIDTGFRLALMQEPIRLAGINTPEIYTVEGRNAYKFLRDLIESKVIEVSTIKPDTIGLPREKYGRFLGIVWYEGQNVNEFLLEMGFATKFMA